MHDNDIAHEALEQAFDKFKNLVEGHVPPDSYQRVIASGLMELTLAMMKINSQIHDIETSLQPSE
ncbi:MAG: hypothetical protein RLZZ505_691 [Verrucomicrobiota bacterium]|jgi:hypothetical protein